VWERERERSLYTRAEKGWRGKRGLKRGRKEGVLRCELELEEEGGRSFELESLVPSRSMRGKPF